MILRFSRVGTVGQHQHEGSLPVWSNTLLALTGSCFFSRAADSSCAAGAIDRAKQLLTFHAGPDDRMTIDKTAKKLPSIRNPENPCQHRFVTYSM